MSSRVRISGVVALVKKLCRSTAEVILPLSDKFTIVGIDSVLGGCGGNLASAIMRILGLGDKKWVIT